MEIKLRDLAKRAMQSVAKKESQRFILRRLYYIGRSFHCPVCASWVRVLRPNGFQIPVLRELDVIGGEYFPADTCPVCRSHSRTRLVHQYLTREVLLTPGTAIFRILHFAPEEGIARCLASRPNTEYLTADLRPEMYPYASNVIRADLTDISLQENSVDLVICNHVLEHVPDDALAMRELHRVLKPGGIAILQVPISTKLKLTDEDHRITSPEQREKRFGQYDHVRLYGSDYTDRLVAAGFSVQTFDPLLTWGAQFIEANRLNPRERLFACRK